MKRYRVPVLKSAGRVVLALLVAIGVWGLVACGGGSSNGIGGVKEPTAYVFNAQTAEKAAFLAVDFLDVFFGISQVTGEILALVEAGKDSEDLSGLCDPGGTAVMNAQLTPEGRLGVGNSISLDLDRCIDGVVGGTVNFSVGQYDENVILPGAFVTMRVRVDLSGGDQTTEARFFVQAFRNTDGSEVGFRYFGSRDREAIWSLTEPAPDGKTSFACFDFNLLFVDNGGGAALVLGDPQIAGAGFWRTQGLIVDERNRLFGLTGAFPRPVESDLRFEQSGGEWVPVSGDGLNFRSQASGSTRCIVVGIDDGITPGTTNMDLRIDEDVLGGVILTVAPPDGPPIRTTWLDLLDD